MVEASSNRLEAIKTAYHSLFASGRTLSKLRDDALGDRLLSHPDKDFCRAGRSLAWKLFFLEAYGGPLPVVASGVSPVYMRDSLHASRKKFVDSLLKFMKAPDGSYEAGLQVPGLPVFQQSKSVGDLDLNNPLSLHNDNPWTEWFASVELRKTIRQDVERTFPEMDYFRDSDVQAQLTNILFLYASANPSIGYRQGMHELLAPLYHAVEFDSGPFQGQTQPFDDAELLGDICDRSWVAADAWTLFTSLMKGASRWYEWREAPPQAVVGQASPLSTHVNINVANGPAAPDYVAPIVKACNNLQSNLLRNVDPVLFKHMQSAGIEPQIYGIRWLRLLFTREFSLRDSMLLWDGLFAVDPTLDLAQWICVAMLVRIRAHLLQSDYSGQLTMLLRYPALPSEAEASTDGMPHHTSLLLRQALAFQMSPTPTTGVSVVLENRNLLNIPLEVPESPPASDQVRRLGHTPREKSASTSDLSHGRGHLPRSPPPQFGFPEGIARGLLERGETLGINKSFLNAVSEFRRNIPDLAASLVRSPNATSPSAYPLTDERPHEERPPWEPRTRFEMEREIAHFRVNNKKLADSVSWIVDTLLQDESESTDPVRVKNIQSRKRDALESLAYVRDVLRTGPESVDDERLYSEEEYHRRSQSTSSASHNRGDSLGSATPGEVRFNLPRPAAPAPVSIADPRPRLTSPHTTTFSSSSTAATPSQRKPVPRMSSSSTLSSSRSPPKNDLTTKAPWNHTKSSFADTPALPTAVLPRPPPPTSTSLLPPPSLDKLNSDQTPRARGRASHSDPLGVLK